MINNTNYKQLCKYCDELLGYNPSISRVAISFLHVIRPHHTHGKHYELIFSHSHLFFCSYILKKLIKNILSFIISCLKIVFERNSSNIKYSEVDVIFVSHLFNLNQTQSSKDLYFNDIHENLTSQSINSKRVFINHSNEKISAYKDLIIGSSKISNEILIRLLQLKQFIILFYYSILKSHTNTERRIKLYAALESLSYSTLYNLRIYFFFKKLIKVFSPKIVITTFEGHAYERIIYKVVNSSTKILAAGYQHSPIFKHQHSMKRNIENVYKPKLIFSSGKITYDLLCQFYKQDQIIELGSSRGEINIKNNNNSNYCLVIPEGMIESVDLFLDYVSQITKTNPDRKFLFRFHPAISISQIKKRQMIYRNNSQIIFSNDSLKDDIKKSKFVLYSGSTAVFSSIIAGLTPIYFDSEELDLNPLYQLKDSIQYVRDIKDFNEIEEDTEAVRNKHITYCKAYFSNFNYRKIISLLG